MPPPTPAPDPPDRFVRRRTPRDRRNGVVLIVWAAVCLLAGAVLALLALVGPVAGSASAGAGLVAVLLVVLGALLAWIGLAMRRARLVADRDGLHVTGAVLTRHLPWPASPGELVVVTTGGSRRSSAVRVQPVDGSRPRWLYALSRSATAPVGRVRFVSAETSGERWRGRVGPEPPAEEEVAALWAWGVAHGCVPPASPTPEGVRSW